MTTGREDEEAPLLEDSGTEVFVAAQTVALSWFQIAVVLLFQLADHIVSQVLNPFLPALVKSLDITGGDEGKASIYYGLLQTLYFSSQTLTTFFWSRTSDMIGRKPILLCGMLASVVSMLGIGTSQAYWWLAVSRCINGAFNGNVGVIKSLMGEVAPNPEKLAQLYSLLPIAWATTGTVGPLVGGYLSSPAERYPDVFGSFRFLKQYPFFLPCAITAAFIAFAWLVTALFFKETLKNRISLATWLGINGNYHARPSPHYPHHVHMSARHDRANDTTSDSERPLPMGELLRNSRVLLVALNYACLCLTQASLNYFQPVQLSTSIENGGMGFDPPLIGRILSANGFMNGILQILFFARIHRYLGSKRFFVCGVTCAIPMILSFPIANFLARTFGIGPSVWFVIGVQVLSRIGVSMSYGALFILIVGAAPNHASLGATNGLCLTSGNLMRAIGPAITNTLFSFSMRGGLLGSYLAYIYLLVVVIVCLTTASALPNELWSKKE